MMSRRAVLACFLLISGCLCMLILGDEKIYTELTFSKASGFYEEPFELELHGPKGTEIYYTLDGSEPDKNAIKYTQPIKINDATDNENVYCLRTDVSAGFLTEDIEASGGIDPAYVTPDDSIDKCTVVRAVCFDIDGKPGDIKTESYFVDYDIKSGYDDLNIISITAKPDDLFNYDTGIYVLGQKYEAYTKTEREADWRFEYWRWWPANYHQRGYEWERSANIQLFNAQKELVISQKCGIRIQGGVSRGNLPKSISIYARESYSGEGRFYVDLFSTGYMADTITLFAGGNDSESKLRDMLMAKMVKNRKFATMSFEPYAMFLNGEYWGVYWLTEKYNDTFLGYYYDVKKDNVIMIKNRELAEGKEADYKLYTDMLEYMTGKDLSIQQNYEYACKLMDMQSLIDYFAAEIYIGRCKDWPNANEALWRVRKTGEKEYEDGRWRWMLFDVNYGALTTELIDADTLNLTMRASAIFNNLCQNEDFRKQFTITFMDLANTCFTQDRIDDEVSNYLSLMTEPMIAHNKRFFGTEDSTKFLDAVADIKNFLDRRRPYAVQYLKSNFALEGRPAPVTIEINDKEAGYIIINTAEVTFHDKAVWSGEYYTDYPITLRAVANQGYRFKGWEEDVISNHESIIVDVDRDGISLKAVFEKVNEKR